MSLTVLSIAGYLLLLSACAASQRSQIQLPGAGDAPWPDLARQTPASPVPNSDDTAEATRNVCETHTFDSSAVAASATTWEQEYSTMLHTLDQAEQEMVALRQIHRSADPNAEVAGYTSFLHRWIRNGDPALVLTDRGFRIADERICRLAAAAREPEQLWRSSQLLSAARADSGVAGCLEECQRWVSGQLSDAPGLGSADVDSERLLAQ